MGGFAGEVTVDIWDNWSNNCLMIKRRWARAIGLKALSSAVLTGNAVALPSFVRPNPGGGCTYPFTGDTLDYYFSNSGPGGAWSAPQKASFTNGAADWSRLRSNANFPLFTPHLLSVAPPSPNSTTVRVQMRAAGSGSFTDCIGGIRSIYIANNETGQAMEYVAAHEIGHAWGLRHDGLHDNLTTPGGFLNPGNVPLMSGCFRPSDPAYDTPKVDDYANVWYKASGTRSLAPDGGFESTLLTTFFQTGVVARDTTYRYAGSRSARIDGAGQVASRVRIASPADAVRGYTQFKTNSPSTNFKAQVRTVSLVAQNFCTDEYTVDYDSVQSLGNWITLANASLANTLTWTPAQSTWSTGWSGQDEIDMQIYVTNNDSNATLWLDDLRIQSQ